MREVIGGRLRRETRGAAEIEGDAAEVAAKMELAETRDGSPTPGGAAAGDAVESTAYNGWIAHADGARPLGNVKRSAVGR